MECLTRQLGCYRQLSRLCDLQRQYVQQNQTDELLTVLEQRGELLQQISELETEVAPMKRNWSEFSSRLTEQDRRRASQMLAETRELLIQITQADQDDVLLLQQRKLNIGKQIVATTQAKAVGRKYAAAAYVSDQQNKVNVKQ
jgi:hypothetical protein